MEYPNSPPASATTTAGEYLFSPLKLRPLDSEDDRENPIGHGSSKRNSTGGGIDIPQRKDSIGGGDHGIRSVGGTTNLRPLLATSPTPQTASSAPSSMRSMISGTDTASNSSGGDGEESESPPTALESERRNQFERKKKRSMRVKKRRPRKTPPADSPSLVELVSASVVSEQIFEKLAEQADDPKGERDPLLGIKVLLKLPEVLQRKHYHLVHFPYLIMENLLMDCNIVEITEVLNHFEELRDNDMLLAYAQKSLTFPTWTSLVKGSNCLQWREHCDFGKAGPSYHKVQQKEGVAFIHDQKFVISWDYVGKWSKRLAGDPVKDEAVRNTHFFSGGTPNVDLCISILQLSKPKKLWQNLIDVCDYLSQEISDISCDQNNYMLGLSVIEQLLIYARNLFANQQNENNKVVLSESYLKDVETLRAINKSKCSVRIPLIDLADKGRSRKLRDSLIQDEEMELAFSISTRYNVAIDPVWAAWGFYLLKIGQYELAKDKFNSCFMSSRKTKISTSTILQRIIKVLDMMPEQQEPTNPNHTDENRQLRFGQCVYYLKKHGTPQMILTFLLKHHKTTEVCQYILEVSLPASTFVEEVISFCDKYNYGQKIQASMKLLDPTLAKFDQYLLAACGFYNNSNDLKPLLLWQVFMKDYARAALTGIKLFVEDQTSPIKQRLEYLTLSKDYFLKEEKFLDEHPGIQGRILVAPEIRKYIKKLTLQQEISFFFLERKIPTTGASIFGSIKQRCGLSQHIIEHGNYDLGLGVILAFELPAAKILSRVVAQLIKNTELKEVKSLIERTKSMIDDDQQWDQFVQMCVKKFVEIGESKLAESFIVYLRSGESKIDCYMWCGKLKRAYLEAVKRRQRGKVEKIRDEAKAKNATREYELCVNYLATAPQEGEDSPTPALIHTIMGDAVNR